MALIKSPFQSGRGLSRRSWLKAGAISLGGLSLADILRCRATSAAEGRSLRETSVIYVFLAGGPSQLETYDPKPNAPEGFRGPLGAIQTSVPGVLFSEFMSDQAQLMDKLAVVRSVHHDFDQSSNHRVASHLVQTGYPIFPTSRADEYPRNPSCGSVAARLRGTADRGVPPYVLLPHLPGGIGYAGGVYLGQGYDPFKLDADPNADDFEVPNLKPVNGLDLQRLSNRRDLLDRLDRQQVDVLSGLTDAGDQFRQQAFDMVTGQRAQTAFDLSREKARVRERYGRNPTGQRFLLARRLIEAGVTFVQVQPAGGSGGGWDDHDGIVGPMRQAGPAYDRGLAALISDLHERCLDRDVLVVAMGEFGRSPRINPKRTGRDHWPAVYSVLFAGGGLKMGQVIGSSSANAEIPASSPYGPQDVLATVYRHLDIDPTRTFDDFAGRPRYILEDARPIRELFS